MIDEKRQRQEYELAKADDAEYLMERVTPYFDALCEMLDREMNNLPPGDEFVLELHRRKSSAMKVMAMVFNAIETGKMVNWEKQHERTD